MTILKISVLTMTLIICNPCLAVTTEEYNQLIGKYNALLASERAQQAQYNELVERYNRLTKKENAHLKQIKQLQTKHKRLIRSIKLPACRAARKTLQQCLPEIFEQK